jgi:predicted unusual protein kinase regulating ubiquinone biosynthesis (AarF/ABC1/UbiB family)
MKLSLKPQHLRRYKEIAQLLFRYANADLVEQFGLQDALTEREPTQDDRSPKPEDLARDLEAMGPTFIKLGQVLSTRPDLLPDAYLRALARLQDKVQPFPYEEVERIVQSELGIRVSKAFLEFDPTPMAAASLAQVHRARLRNWREVVVKVQRPDVRKQIGEDVEVLEEIVSFLDQHTEFGKRYQLLKIFDEFRRSLVQELDYQREAINLVNVGANLAEFQHIRIPQPVADYTTRAVLTMDYVRGTKITEISRLLRTEIDGTTLADELFHAYLKQVLVDGVFHADPHPGNVLLTDDGRIALVDLGLVGRVSPEMQMTLLKLLLAVSEGRSEDAATLAIQVSDTAPDFDESEFRRRIGYLVAEQQQATLQQMDIGRTLLELGRSAGQNGLYVPTELTLLGKTLLQLDEIGRVLDPAFNPNQAVRKHVTELLNYRVKKDLSPHSLFASLLEVKDFVGHLPAKASRILDAIANAEFELKIKTQEVHVLLDGFQKIANRITTGLILAALIIGASLLMQVQTAFRIFGYPGLAMLFFLIAAGLGLWLVCNILLKDQKSGRKRRE